MLKKIKVFLIQNKAYFQSETYINLEATDVKELLSKMIYEIFNKIASYQRNSSGWYFKDVLPLEIHTIDYKPMKGSSYIPLPDFILKRKQLQTYKTKTKNVFSGRFLDIFIQLILITQDQQI